MVHIESAFQYLSMPLALAIIQTPKMSHNFLMPWKHSVFASPVVFLLLWLGSRSFPFEKQASCDISGSCHTIGWCFWGQAKFILSQVHSLIKGAVSNVESSKKHNPPRMEWQSIVKYVQMPLAFRSHQQMSPFHAKKQFQLVLVVEWDETQPSWWEI